MIIYSTIFIEYILHARHCLWWHIHSSKQDRIHLFLQGAFSRVEKQILLKTISVWKEDMQGTMKAWSWEPYVGISQAESPEEMISVETIRMSRDHLGPGQYGEVQGMNRAAFQANRRCAKTWGKRQHGSFEDLKAVQNRKRRPTGLEINGPDPAGSHEPEKV